MSSTAPPSEEELALPLALALAAHIEAGDPVVDLRSAQEFSALHIEGSTALPADEIASRWCEMPPHGCRLAVVRPRNVPLPAGMGDLWRVVLDVDAAQLQRLAQAGGWRLAAGADSRRLWQPNPLLLEMVEAVEAAGHGGGRPMRALDVGAGSGRDSAFLASRGWDVVAVDNQARALRRAAALVARHARPPAACVCVVADLVKRPDALLRAAADHGPPALVLVSRLHLPALLPVLRACADAPGTWVLYHSFASGAEAFGHPSRPEQVVQPGQLEAAFPEPAFEQLARDVRPIEDGRPITYFAARRRGDGGGGGGGAGGGGGGGLEGSGVAGSVGAVA